MFGKRKEGRKDGGRASKLLSSSTNIDNQPEYANAATSQSICPAVCGEEAIVQPISTTQKYTPEPDFKPFNPVPVSLQPNTIPPKAATLVMKLTQLLNKRRRNPKEHWRIVRSSKKCVNIAKIEEVLRIEDIRPFIEVNINNTAVNGLLNIGASISCLGKDAFETLHRCNIKWKEINSAIKTASGQDQEVKGYADVSMMFRGKSNQIRLYIIPSLSQSLYLGIYFWVSFNLLPKLEGIDVPELVDPNMHELNSQNRKLLDKVIESFPSCEKEGIGKTTLLRHKIDVGEAPPSKQRYYAVSPAIQKKCTRK